MGTIKIVDNTIHSAKIFLYKQEDNERLFLVIQEPEGLYGFVGGAQETSDQKMIDTAHREIQEAIGLTPLAYDLVESPITHEFIHSDPRSPRYKKKGILHAFTAQYNEIEPISLNPELLKFDWLTRAEAIIKITDSYPYLTEVFQKVIDLLE